MSRECHMIATADAQEVGELVRNYQEPTRPWFGVLALALALLAVACSGSVEYDETCELLTVRPVQPNGGCCDDVVTCASGRCVDGTCESGVD